MAGVRGPTWNFAHGDDDDNKGGEEDNDDDGDGDGDDDGGATERSGGGDSSSVGDGGFCSTTSGSHTLLEVLLPTSVSALVLALVGKRTSNNSVERRFLGSVGVRDP